MFAKHWIMVNFAFLRNAMENLKLIHPIAINAKIIFEIHICITDFFL